ncbi:MAG: STAS domain-containing protein [Acidobacteriota bacterium]
MSLSIHHEEPDSTTAVVILSGRLLLGPACLELERLMADLLARGFRHVTVDMGSLTHIDSTGMGRFIDAYSKLKKLDGTLRLVKTSGAVRDMFRITRLDTILNVES